MPLFILFSIIYKYCRRADIFEYFFFLFLLHFYFRLYIKDLRSMQERTMGGIR